MNFLKNLSLFDKNSENKISFNNGVVDQYEEIAELVKEARIQKNLTIQELSFISRIPTQTIHAIEDNNKHFRPEYPFIRSILIKLEECLVLKKNTLVKLAIQDRKTIHREKKALLINKFDLLNTWQGSVFYFFILILTIFILKRYFVSTVKVIEIQNIENKIIDK